MRKSLCILIITAFLLVPIASFGGGGEPCGLYLVFDRYEFNSNDEIPIIVRAVCDDFQGRTATVIVSDGNSLEIKNTLLEEKLVVNNFAKTTVKLPASENYRFLVTLMDRGYISDQVMIFTKEGASELLISDVYVESDVKAEELMRLEARVTDGIGNPVPRISVAALIQYKVCADREDYGSLHITLSPLPSDPSEFIGIWEIPNDIPAGTYNVTINAGVIRGYEDTQAVLQTTILRSDQVPVTRLFEGVQAANRDYLGYTAGDTIIMQGRTMSDGCIDVIPDVEIMGEFRSDTMPSIAIQNKTRSDSNGNFAIEFATDPNMPVREVYVVTLEAKYNNRKYSYSDSYALQYIKKFVFEADGKQSHADVLITSPDTSIVSFILDKDAKKLVLVTKSPDVVSLNIVFPPDLLSGDIIIQKDGSETLILSDNENYDTLTGQWTNQDGYSLPYSYYMSAYKGEDYIDIQYIYQRSGESKLEITGTNIIPEFPVNLMVITAIALIGVLIAARWRGNILLR